jgi:hypothetical protein
MNETQQQKQYKLIPKTNDLTSDMSWFIEWAAYGLSGDTPRRQGFEKKLRTFLEDRELYIARKEDF